jgi:hypothetical protein
VPKVHFRKDKSKHYSKQVFIPFFKTKILCIIAQLDNSGKNYQFTLRQCPYFGLMIISLYTLNGAFVNILKPISYEEKNTFAFDPLRKQYARIFSIF